MQRAHIHMPNWAHGHKVNWHTVGTHLGDLIHNPAFWSGLVLAALFLTMIIAAIYSKYAGTSPLRPTYPSYPYMP